MIKAIALDDEPPSLDIIKSFCTLAHYIDLVKTFTGVNDALKYLNSFPVDLLFLDINMPSISGIDFKKQLDPSTMVIFTTAYSQFAVEGFNLNAVDYLLKPFTPERFLQAAEKAKAQYQFLHQNTLVKPEYIFVRVNYSLAKVKLADITLVEGLDDYVKLYVQGQKPLLSRMTMKAIMEKLPQSDFVRVHRSYIVPLAKIEAVRNKVIVVSGKEIPIGISYENTLNEVLRK